MWLSVIVKVVTSDMAKALIAMLLKKLLDHKEDGITKELATTLVDGIALSRLNNLSIEQAEQLKLNL